MDARPLATWWASTSRDWRYMGMVSWDYNDQEFVPHIWGWSGVALRAAGKGKGKGWSLKGTPAKGQKGHGKVGKGQKGHGKARKGQKGHGKPGKGQKGKGK